jgi:ribonuclease E
MEQPGQMEDSRHEAHAAPGEEAKPAPARRSRRGGRRRNKSKAAAGQNGADGSGANGAEALTPELDAKDNRGAKARNAKAKDAGDAQTEAETPQAAPGKADAGKTASGKRAMFVSVLSGELVEVVLAEGGIVHEYYVEMQHQAKVKGNIYKGIVSNIDANLQAAFISYAGGVKNGFLQVDEIHPEYYLSHHDPNKGRKFPPIQKVLKPGQEILVQVVKEPAGTKGAFLTSYLSLPGRFLVLTPGREQIGVSRKVDNEEERARLRELLQGLTPGKGLGVIVRTVSMGASKTSLQRDLQFLKRLWKEVRTKGQSAPSPGLVYEELDLSTRAVRDYLTDDVQEVWVDDPDTARQVAELAALLFPKKQNLVQVHQDSSRSLFERFSLQKQLDQIHSREVSLPSGGRLAIDNTEALTAIDINSGRSGGKNSFEDMAYRTNLEAARAIPLQLRLRDIGGQVVVDFIEMRDRDHWRELEKTVRAGMKGDRARYDVGKIGPFGMLEIVRQRLGSSAISISTEPCPCCKGTGIRRNMEWQAMQSLRDISRLLRQASANNHASMVYPAETELAFYLLNAKRAILRSLENESGVALVIQPGAAR